MVWKWVFWVLVSSVGGDYVAKRTQGECKPFGFVAVRDAYIDCSSLHICWIFCYPNTSPPLGIACS